MTLCYFGESERQAEADMPPLYTRLTQCGVLVFDSRIVLMDYSHSIGGISRCYPQIFVTGFLEIQ